MSLKVDVTGSSSGFEQALNAAKQHADKFGQELNRSGQEASKSWATGISSLAGGIAGAFSFEAIKGFIADMLQTGKSIRETAEQFDISTDAAQKWDRALEKAGVSQGVFIRSLETLRQKRQEAREDASKLTPFKDLGLGSQALDPKVSDLQLLDLVRNSGASRTSINELLGRRGATLKNVHPEGASPDFSETDLEKMHGLEQKSNSIWREIRREGSDTLIGIFSLFSSEEWSKRWENLKGNGNRMKAIEELDRANAKLDEDNQAKQDADDAKKIQDRAELRKHLLAGDSGRELEEGEFHLRGAERGNMTIGARRNSLRKEVADITKRILMERSALDHGLSDSEKAALSPDEQRKLLDQWKLNLLSDQAKKAGLLGELRERPHDMHADSLSHSGLFTGAALRAGNAATGKMDHLLTLTQQIANNTDQRKGLTRSSSFDS
jgi:hypothetical protein